MGQHWSEHNDYERDPGRDRSRDHRRPRRSNGPPPWLQEIFSGLGGGQPGPGSAATNRGPRVRRGDVRVAIIDVLHRSAQDGESINGYQVIQQISDLSDGQWRPSPGSVYPTIAQLQDEGLVESDDERARRTIRLTEAGRRWAEDNTSELAGVWAPFQSRTERQEKGQGADIKSEVGQVMSAVWQLVTQGSDSQRTAALGVLVETRRSLYGILADGRDSDADDEVEGELDGGL